MVTLREFSTLLEHPLTKRFIKEVYNLRLTKAKHSVNQYLRHNLGYKQNIQVIRRNQVFSSFSHVSTDTTVIVKD